MICHAEGCNEVIKDDYLMCAKHWYMVPQTLRSDVWHTWADGDGAGTYHHTIAKTKAILAVAVKEGKITKDQADERLAKLKRRIE